MNLIIDGNEWDLPCDVERIAEVQSSDISGLLLDKTYFNDVIGTYLKYDIRIEVPFGRENTYNEFYDNVLVAPVDHECYLPYVGGMIKVVGRIENIKDIFVRHVERDALTGKKREVFHWKGITFSVVSNHPTKKVVRSEDNQISYEDENGEIVTVGIEFPNESNVNVGEVYIYTPNGWEILPDADDYQY